MFATDTHGQPVGDHAAQNLLLGLLWPRLSSALQHHLKSVQLTPGMVMTTAGQPSDGVYFIGSGLVAMRTEVIDIALIGCEGMTGVHKTMHADKAPYSCVVQIAGQAHRMDGDIYARLLTTQPVFRDVMLRYAQTLTIQIAEHAVCNAHQSLQARVARWLLMCHDRLGRTEINITHAFLAATLCVRRAGVTDALHVLEGIHAIYSKRGLITIRDRDRLKDAAQRSYGVAEAEYRHLLTDRRPSFSADEEVSDSRLHRAAGSC